MGGVRVEGGGEEVCQMVESGLQLKHLNREGGQIFFLPQMADR